MFREAARRDEGFSVAEVIIAASILFFVLTAMVGLMGASQQMGVSAKQRTVVTNAMAEYIDKIRATDFYTIALEPDGAIKPVEDVVYGPYTVRFTNQVTNVEPHGAKHLRSVHVQATCVIDGRTFTSSSVVYIKNPNLDTTADQLLDPDAPIIEFTSATPPENAVLYGTQVFPSGHTVRIGTDVRSPNDLIERVEYRVDSVLVQDGAAGSAEIAVFTFTPALKNVSPESEWDTQQEGVGEGLRTVTVVAYDDKGRWSTRDRIFIVDNELPGVPGPITGTTSTGYRGLLQFQAAQDPVVAEGEDPQTFATRYGYRLHREPSGYALGPEYWLLADEGTVDAGHDVISATKNQGPIRIAVPTEPLSRYRASVWAGSPREFNWDAPSEMGYAFVSRPEVLPTATKESVCTTDYRKITGKIYTDYNVVLYVTKPTFPVNAAETRYEIQAKRPTDGSAWYPVTPLTGWSVDDAEGEYLKVSFTYRDEANTAQALSFRVGVNVTPIGWAGGTPTGLLYTNAAGAAPIDLDDSTATLTGPLVPDSTWSQ